MSMKTFLIVAVATVAFAVVLAAPVDEKGLLFQVGNVFFNVGNASSCPKELENQWVTVGNLTCRCRRIRPLFPFRPPTFAWELCKKAQRPSTTENPTVTTPLNPITGNPVEPTTEAPVIVEVTTGNSDSQPQEPTTGAPIIVEVTTSNSDSEPQEPTTSVSENEP